MPDSSSPVEFAWRSIASPETSRINIQASPQGKGRCALCRLKSDALYRVNDVVSDNSTIWDDLRPSDSDMLVGLCEACTWGFRVTEGRGSALYITAQGAQWLTVAEAVPLLTRSLSTDDSLTIPVRGRKHLVPFMQWGTVTSDAAQRMKWGATEAELARAVLLLRKGGASWTNLAAASPSVTDRLSLRKAMPLWNVVRAWKQSPQLETIVGTGRRAGTALDLAGVSDSNKERGAIT